MRNPENLRSTAASEITLNKFKMLRLGSIKITSLTIISSRGAVIIYIENLSTLLIRNFDFSTTSIRLKRLKFYRASFYMFAQTSYTVTVPNTSRLNSESILLPSRGPFITYYSLIYYKVYYNKICNL